MPRQFGVPDEVVGDVESGQNPITVYSSYLSELHDRNVIGANVAFLLGDWISVFYFCDRQFFRIYWEEILKFKNLKATCCNHLDRKLLPKARNIKRLRRDNRGGLSNKQDTICWNFNTGAASIDFAVHAGVKRVLLLGFDMQLNNNRSHWHEGFQPYQLTPRQSFKRFLKGFAPIARDAKKRKVEILNVNKDSAIKEFKKVELKDVL